MPEMISVPALGAILSAASDAFPFLLEPETFPVFYAWMQHRGQVAATYTAEQMHQDLTVIYSALGRYTGA